MIDVKDVVIGMLVLVITGLSLFVHYQSRAMDDARLVAMSGTNAAAVCGSALGARVAKVEASYTALALEYNHMVVLADRVPVVITELDSDR
jgi:hypothetical protein